MVSRRLIAGIQLPVCPYLPQILGDAKRRAVNLSRLIAHHLNTFCQAAKSVLWFPFSHRTKTGRWEQITDFSHDSFMMSCFCFEILVYFCLVLCVQPMQCLKVLTMSGWNPPPGNRKMHGDLMYLYIVTVEDRHISITASTRGFYLNQ